ncbi:COG1361 S-layer family protein [Candidatus Woesearchaeota archaeon]|nr:COG1361 S-layer family protein [Candidatus Woesearchaeota archaeon]
MKKTNGMIIILMAMIALVAFQATAMTTFPDIKVTLLQQTPDPVNPGDTFEVKFRVENNGSDTASDVKLRLGIDYPFSFYVGTQGEIDIGELPYSDSGEYSVVKTWKLLVDSNALTGTETVDLWFKIGNQGWIKTGEYDVNVRSSNPFLAINKIESIPERIVPGTTTKVSFVLENLATDDLRDITLNLQTYNSITTTTGVTVQELPFTAIGSGNEKTISMIKYGKSAAITFDLFTDADADSKLYKVPFTLAYSDSAGNEYTRTGVVGLLVDSNPEMTVYVDNSEVKSAGEKGEVTIKFVNKGFSDIKFLDIELLEGEGFKILSTPQVYVGKLDSDDYETAEYDILVSADAKEQVLLPLKIDYRDANGERYEENLDLPLQLYTSKELKDNGNGGSNGWVWLIVIVAIVGGGYWLYWRRKNKKRK